MPPPPFGNAIPQLWLSHIFHLCLNQKNGQNENKRTIHLMPRKINRISLYWFTFICNVWSYVVSATKIALELANCTKFCRYTLLLLCWRVCSRPLCSQPNPNTTTSQRRRKLPSRRCWTRLTVLKMLPWTAQDPKHIVDVPVGISPFLYIQDAWDNAWADEISSSPVSVYQIWFHLFYLYFQFDLCIIHSINVSSIIICRNSGIFVHSILIENLV